MIPEYEHLDVIWAMDAETQIFQEVREVLWRTVPEEERASCRVPKGCDHVEVWVDDRKLGRGNDEEDMHRKRTTGGVDGEGESSGSSSEELSSAS